MSTPLFRTITSDDWKRSLAAARTDKNAVREEIRARIAAQNRDVSPTAKMTPALPPLCPTNSDDTPVRPPLAPKPKISGRVRL